MKNIQVEVHIFAQDSSFPPEGRDAILNTISSFYVAPHLDQ